MSERSLEGRMFHGMWVVAIAVAVLATTLGASHPELAIIIPLLVGSVCGLVAAGVVELRNRRHALFPEGDLQFASRIHQDGKGRRQTVLLVDSGALTSVFRSQVQRGLQPYLDIPVILQWSDGSYLSEERLKTRGISAQAREAVISAPLVSVCG